MSFSGESYSLKPIERTTIADQISGQLLQLIREGRFIPGERMPSERQLCEISELLEPLSEKLYSSLSLQGFQNVKQTDCMQLTTQVLQKSQTKKLKSSRTQLRPADLQRFLLPSQQFVEQPTNNVKNLQNQLSHSTRKWTQKNSGILTTVST